METVENHTSKEGQSHIRKDIHQEITDTIIHQLEKGVIPWQQTWINNQPVFSIPRNLITGNRYRGINILLLWSAAQEKNYTVQEWASFKQWNSKNENVRKGEKGTFIVYADTFEKEVEGEIKKIPFLKSSVVFNRSQLASYNPEEINTEIVRNEIDRNKTVDDFIENTFAQIAHRDGGACYVPSTDQIYMPLSSTFIDIGNCTAAQNYYSTLLHELTHWTGHSSRLNRLAKTQFGKSDYAQEELVAELGAAFLTTEFGITNPEKENHAGYIAGWLKVLKNNKHFIISAASEASKAVEFLNEMQPLKLVM
ncbi:MAG TPA: zincin-like metallopeptidase domain-containing protein [Ferruginibacter sp.]|nr:zincin-like metallopeptidase domain-containing protein [Ferruginibacter sp.]